MDIERACSQGDGTFRVHITAGTSSTTPSSHAHKPYDSCRGVEFKKTIVALTRVIRRRGSHAPFTIHWKFLSGEDRLQSLETPPTLLREPFIIFFEGKEHTCRKKWNSVTSWNYCTLRSSGTHKKVRTRLHGPLKTNFQLLPRFLERGNSVWSIYMDGHRKHIPQVFHQFHA